MKQYIFVGLLMVCVGCGGEWLTSAQVHWKPLTKTDCMY